MAIKGIPKFPKPSKEQELAFDEYRLGSVPFYKITTPEGKVIYDPSLEPWQIEISERRSRAMGEYKRTKDKKRFRATIAAINEDAARYRRERSKKD